MLAKVVCASACLAVAHALAGQAMVNASRTNATKKSSVCDCMSWADVYYSGKASCGRALELYFLSKYGFSAAYAATEPITGLPHKVCVDFFKNFQTPSCVNVDLYPSGDDMTGKQWCYVSNDCGELNGGSYATNQIGFAQGGWHNLQSTGTLSWKICDASPPDPDPMLKYWSVEDLKSTGEYSDVSMSRLLRLAYPMTNITWGEAKWFMEAVDAAYAPGKTITETVDDVSSPTSTWGSRLVEVYSEMSDIVKSERGMILDSPGHGDNFHVIYGRAAWEVRRIELGDMAYLGGHFFMEFDVNCVSGCATAERLEALDLETL